MDSGASRVLLNSKYITKEDSNRKTISASKGVNGNISGMDITKVELLDFNGIQLKNQELITLDLSQLEEALKMDIHGLIGYELIQDYDLIFDYEKLKITLINLEIFDRYKNENLSEASLQRVPLELEGHIPVVNAKVGDFTYSFGIDCGAESNLMSETLFEALKKETKKIKTDELIGAENQPKNVKKGKVKKTTLGTKAFKNLPTVFSDISHLNDGYKINIDGLLGYQILHQQKTLLSYARSEMIFIE